MTLLSFTHNNNAIVINILLIFLVFLIFLIFLVFLVFLVFSLRLFLFCILPRVFILHLVLTSLDLFLLQTLQTSDKILNRKVDNMIKTSNVMFVPDLPYAVLLPQQLLKVVQLLLALSLVTHISFWHIPNSVNISWRIEPRRSPVCRPLTHLKSRRAS